MLSFYTKAQIGFIQHYDFGVPGSYFSSMVLDEDTLIITGLISPEQPPYTQGILFAKLDTLGNILSFITHFDSLDRHYYANHTPSGLIKLQDNSGYILTGGVSSGNGIVMKLDNNGELIWVKEYFDNSSLIDFFSKIIEVEDGLLIGGRKQALNHEMNIFIKKLNYQGDELWQKLYGENNGREEHLGSFIKLGDNEFVIGANSGTNANLPWQQFLSKVEIFAIDSLGNEIWSWESDLSLEELWIRGLNRDDNGNWIYATVLGEFEFDGFLKRQPRLMIRDSNFNVIEEKFLAPIAGNYGHVVENVIPLSGGEWLGVGSVADSVDVPIIAIGHLAAWTFKFNETGDTLWERRDLTFPDTLSATVQILHSAVELSSGSIVVAGNYEDAFQSTPDWGIILKMNKNGCMDTLFCSQITSLNDFFLEDEIKVFPNPTENEVSFVNQDDETWDTIEIFDFSGKMLKTVKNKNIINLEKLASGIYLAKIWKSGKYKFEKVMKK